MVTPGANILQMEKWKEALCIYVTCAKVQDMEPGLL